MTLRPQKNRLQPLFSSETDLWATPLWLFQALHAEFKFEVDVCAIVSNAKCRRYFSPAKDGLKQPWTGRCWMNPPYGRHIKHWVKKAYRASQEGSTVVALLPARTDTAWWHDFVMRAAEIRFIRGRLAFGGATSSAPFPSAIVVFRPPRASLFSFSRRPPTISHDSSQSRPPKSNRDLTTNVNAEPTLWR